jgi:hypothetical protein
MSVSDFELESSPFIKAFVYSILKTIKHKGRQALSEDNRGKKYIINSDLIPKVHETVIVPKMLSENRIDFKKMTPSLIHNEQHNIPSKSAINSQMPSRQSPVPRAMPAPKNYFNPGKYGKIQPLLDDPSVTLIECPGENKNLIITRMQFSQPMLKQPARIVLSKEEIKNFLNNISEETRVPLIEGAFRAAVDNFVVDAIFSDLIGARFLIKKRQSSVPQFN